MQIILFGLFAVSVIFGLQYTDAQQAEIPNYLKNKIKLWALDKMSDESFVNTLDELGQRGLLKIKQTTVQNAYNLPEYGKTTFVKIMGRVNDYGLTSHVSLIIIAPDGLRTEYTVPVLQSGAYSTLIPLYFSSTLGTYKVFAYHNGKELPETFFYAKKDTKIPVWIKNSVRLWVDGKTSERDFLFAMQYLLDRKVIEPVASKPRTDLDVAVNGHKTVRRGTTQDITVYVSNTAGVIEGAKVSVRVEDYGKDVLEEFEGVTNSNGTYNISWELSKDWDDIKTFFVFVDVTDGISSKTKLFSFQVYCLCGESNCRCRN